MNVKHASILSLLLCLLITPVSEAATIVTDNFNSLNTTVWGCEYACPAVANGYARCNLQPGSVNTNATWSKLSYKNKSFSYGTYSMTFRYSRRPLECEVWAGWALYTETASGVQEINFGIETACRSRCNDQTLIMESYKDSKNNEVIIPLGVNLVDNTWHTVELTYTASRISLTFDGKQMASITDVTTIPTTPMKLIPGARVVSGSLTSPFYLDIDSISISDSISQTAPVTLKEQITIKLAATENAQISIYNSAGKKVGTAESITGIHNFNTPHHIRGAGVYILQVKSGNSVNSRKIIKH